MATLATATEKKPGERLRRSPSASRSAAGWTTSSRSSAARPTKPLADEVCAFLGIDRAGRRMVTRFADGEAYVQIQENVRGADVFVIQPTCRPVDEHLMELLLMIDALKRASARRITAVIPYLWLRAGRTAKTSRACRFRQAGGGSADHRRAPTGR